MYNKLTKDEIISKIKSKLQESLHNNLDFMKKYKIEIDYTINSLFDINNDLLPYFSDQELAIIRNRNGININMTPKTQKEIGEVYGCTANYISTLENNVYKKLRRYLTNLSGKYNFSQLQLSDTSKIYILNNENIKSANDYYKIIFCSNETPEIKKVKNEFIDKLNGNIASCPLEYLGFSNKILEILKSYQIVTLQDLISRKSEQIAVIPGIDVDMYIVINERIYEIGYNFSDQQIIPDHIALDMTLEDFANQTGLTVRSYNCLKRAGIEKLSELCNYTYDDLIKIRNMGIKTAEEIYEKLQKVLGERNLKPTNDNSKSNNKQSNDSDDIQEIINKKEKLLNKYKAIVEEKERLVRQEQELDIELKKIIQQISQFDMENKNESTK